MNSSEIDDLIKIFDQSTKKQIRVQFSILCAERVLPIFEQRYPDDKRPRQAIEAAKEWMRNPTEKNAKIAYAAAIAVLVASNAVYAIEAGYAYSVGISNNEAAYDAAYSAYHAAANIYYADSITTGSAACFSACASTNRLVEHSWQRQTLHKIIKPFMIEYYEKEKFDEINSSLL